METSIRSSRPGLASILTIRTGKDEVSPIQNGSDHGGEIRKRMDPRQEHAALQMSLYSPASPVSSESYELIDDIPSYPAAGALGRIHSWPPNSTQPSPFELGSPRYVFQWTDPKCEMKLLKEYHPPVSHMSDDSSSAYSQSSGFEHNNANRLSSQRSGSVPWFQSNTAGHHFSSSSTVQDKQSAPSPTRSIRYRDRVGDMFRSRKPRSPAENNRPAGEGELSTLQEMLEEEQKKHENTIRNDPRRSRGFTESELDLGGDRPLTIRTRQLSTDLQSPKRSSMLTNMRESFSRGMEEISSPNQSKNFSTPTFTSPSNSNHSKVAFTRNVSLSQGRDDSPNDMTSPRPSLPHQAKRSFGSGRHPLKTPFPFAAIQEHSSSEDEAIKSHSTPGKFNRKLSDAVKSISKSRSTRDSPVRKKNVIPNRQRTPNGPDTPLPMVSGFSEQISEAVATAKKSLHVKSSDEKKRECLKKKIVVLGITDQNPGIFSSLSNL
ncbi:uncharacterized protein BP5553_06203 [Venustampulla echinocandica]|uniref:Uncharacterized protein n=1 Tax=Venustampulla echinocandica TaxID=2656787 RepID=A0A370TMW0_9HELO|nr:uncharacterized protein BP5553_06203 [Venustampulla echinocandica]RDL36851.1 hypothetical protein BP5553_06203 [Venustampulla echinocandica]